MTFWAVLFLLLSTVAKITELTRTPFFGDEALYCYLGLKFIREPFWNALSTAVNYWKDAPGLLLLNAISLRIFGQTNPILSCRLTGVFSSLVSGTTFYYALKFINIPDRVRITALLFLLINPFSFFFDRTSLMDTPLLTFILFFLVASVVYLKHGSTWRLGMALFGYILAFLTKFNAVIILPLVLVVSRIATHRAYRRIFATGLVLTTILLVVASYLYTNVWETVFYHMDTNNLSLESNLIRMFKNLKAIIVWYSEFLTPATLFILVWGIVNAVRRKHYYAFTSLIFLILFYSVVSGNLFPRYLLITLPLISLLVGYVAYSRLGFATIMVLLIIFSIRDMRIVMTPNSAPIARHTKYEFFEDWGSGIGTEKLFKYFKTRPGQMPHALLAPTDLEGLFSIEKEMQVPKTSVILVFYRDTSDIENYLLTSGNKKIYLATTPFHERFVDYVNKISNTTKILETNGMERNSILLYDVTQIK